MRSGRFVTNEFARTPEPVEIKVQITVVVVVCPSRAVRLSRHPKRARGHVHKRAGVVSEQLVTLAGNREKEVKIAIIVVIAPRIQKRTIDLGAGKHGHEGETSI